MIIKEIVRLRQFAEKIERKHRVSEEEVDEVFGEAATSPENAKGRETGRRSLSSHGTDEGRALPVDFLYLQRMRSSTSDFCS